MMQLGRYLPPDAVGEQFVFRLTILTRWIMLPPMNAKLFALVLGCAGLLAGPALRAGETTATSPTGTPPAHRDGPPPRNMAFLLPPPMLEKLNLTDEQKTKLKSIEESFGKAQHEYYLAHNDEIEAARKALEKAMSGLQEQRQAAMEQIKALLTPEQKALIQNARGEGHGPAKEHNAVKPPAE